MCKTTFPKHQNQQYILKKCHDPFCAIKFSIPRNPPARWSPFDNSPPMNQIENTRIRQQYYSKSGAKHKSGKKKL